MPLALTTGSLLVVLALWGSVSAPSSVPPLEAASGSSVGRDQAGAPDERPPGLNVPYLPQTEALCGGAAAAMVLRYWGDRHAAVAQFAPLVDRSAGGIATDRLSQSLTDRGWQVAAVQGTVDLIQRELAAGHPLILLLEDRPTRFHYLVAIAADNTRIWLHDPTWGPARPYAATDLVRRWKAANFWALVVLPGPSPVDRNASALTVSIPRAGSVDPARGDPTPGTPCRQALDEAIADIEKRGLGAADDLLRVVRAQCPGESGPISELAGVRVAQQRFVEATSLASEAVRLDPGDSYGWDVLGSSRFMQNDPDEALRAWNHIGKPRLDSAHIVGLKRTRYALVSEMLTLTPDSLLTAQAYARSRRRLELLPDRVSSRIDLRPESDGFATVEAALTERTRWPVGVVGWGVTAGRAFVNHEVREAIPGWSGQGEVWDVQGRWWENRPRVALAFVAPRAGWWPGIWHMDSFVETETYATGGGASPVRERQTHAGVGVTDWLTAQLRYQMTAGADWWDGQKTVSVGGSLDRRMFSDRLSASGAIRHWESLTGATGFRTASATIAFRTSATSAPLVLVGDAHVEMATRAAPLALWPGAGDGHSREGLLRAHPLVHDGIIDGPVFGRRLTRIGVEGQRWFEHPAIAPVGLALFADAARADHTISGTGATPTHVDVGVGVRLRAPGRDVTLRLDYAQGLRDGRHAITVGWSGTTPLPPRP